MIFSKKRNIVRIGQAETSAVYSKAYEDIDGKLQACVLDCRRR
ncbi:MAG TPA: hypothetical protein VM512_15875 [Burkholderiaceae bacterium]|nr:hypothetical protein [Burkholderiaceae bacterium]